MVNAFLPNIYNLFKYKFQSGQEDVGKNFQ